MFDYFYSCYTTSGIFSFVLDGLLRGLTIAMLDDCVQNFRERPGKEFIPEGEDPNLKKYLIFDRLRFNLQCIFLFSR